MNDPTAVKPCNLRECIIMNETRLLVVIRNCQKKESFGSTGLADIVTIKEKSVGILGDNQRILDFEVTEVGVNSTDTRILGIDADFECVGKLVIVAFPSAEVDVVKEVVSHFNVAIVGLKMNA